MAAEENYCNSIGMKMVRIHPGSFSMGSKNGDLDETPVHCVKIESSFYMGAYEVTNAQYEEYDPSHRALRGKLGFSNEDDEAVVFVSWYDAMGFCRWLSDREGLPYRLPTEAEWEYSARAGTETEYYTGDSLPEVYHKNQRESWYPETAPEKVNPADVMPLTVGLTPPNPWGLYDMHGNVEEWCLDWYGPYEAEDQADPVGRASGEFRVTRGGSHSTEVYYLRSANRMGTLPEDRQWLTGFRVVCGSLPDTEPCPAVESVRERQRADRKSEPDADIDMGKPYFAKPRSFVKLTPDKKGPFFHHNHVPAIVECPNKDLLAIWFTCERESGREMALAASRLRHGCGEWEEATLFWNPPDRNVTGSALWADEKGTLFHFNGLGASSTWANLALTLRTSDDNGVTWSPARLVHPEHGLCNMPIASAFQTKAGAIILPCDAVTGGEGGTVIHVSEDGGHNWERREGRILGIHAPVAERSDGSLIAFGRGDRINGKMPMSISRDLGRTWESRASEFPPISMGQRSILRRLREGPLFFASFGQDMVFTDLTDRQFKGSGLFAALSFDDGETWPVKKLVTDEGPERELEGGAWTGRFVLSYDRAEPKGYLTAIQGKNGMIHLISSALHYCFNLQWLMAPPEGAPHPE